ncbi:MAG: hypothetical protein DRI23_04810 [Candidatus Cloacimonadota bacterium]|nr:MAG: hypothetical protein DRI23_04810 [Candidatus Cloacimonadota bacterium]
MKNLMILVFLVLISSINAEWINIEQNSDEELFEFVSYGLEKTDLEFKLDGYEQKVIYENGNEYKQIDYKNEGKFLEFGMPDLPRFTRMIAIPDYGTTNVTVTYFEEEMIENILIYPIQELQLESQPNRAEFIRNEEFYNGKSVFPKQIVEVSEPVIFRDIRLVSVTVNPFQYDPASRELKVYHDISVTINTDTSSQGINPKLSSRKLSRSFEPLYKAVIENYDEIVRNTDDIYQEPCYLLIYRDDNTAQTYLEYIEDWKVRKGFEFHLVSSAETGTSTGSIKNYIQNAYDTWENPPEFVAIAGDVSGTYGLPTFFENFSGYGGEGDHPYSQLEGNDILADVIIGRLSFETITHLQIIVSKILNYEREPYLGNTDWYEQAVMAGDPSSSGPSCVFTKQAIKEMMEYYVPDFEFSEAYSGGYSSTMTSALNAGVSYLNYRGYIGMSGFDNSSINGLNNGFMLPFAVFMTCDTGSFASYSPSRSETFLRAGNSATSLKGAIAAIGTATSGTHTMFNNCTDAGTYYGVFADKIYNPGGALLRGKLHLFNSFPGDPSSRVSIFSHWNTLMGDPSIELWTGVPQPMDITYDASINLGANFLQVSVLDDSGDPIENAWVTAYMENEDFVQRGYTNEQGLVYLPMEDAVLGTVDLTITHHNNIPHLGSFEVISEPLFISESGIVIDDDNNGYSNGNDDDLVNPGENIELQVGLKNYGSQTANNVSATISSQVSFITIDDNTEDYGNIDSGSTNYCADSYKFSVDENVLGGEVIQLDLDILDSSGNQWDDHIFIPIAAANLDVSDYTIIDANGMLNPGDTVELVVSLFNSGSAESTSLQGELSSENEYITLIDSIADFVDILPGQSGDNDASRFELSADSHCINGSQIEFNLELSNGSGFYQTITFLIDVGIVTVLDPLGPDSYGYYAYDSNDETYDLHPMFNWLEIDPSYGGSGTSIPLYDSGDTGAVDDVAMPFTFNFYGVNYDMISVCSNGWIAPGGSEQASFMNSQIPAPQGPSPMIAPFWDDLVTTGGSVLYYYDLAEHAFIIEWSRVHTDFANSEETFQVIIYDPAVYPTPSGDAEIVFQYLNVTNSSSGNYGGYPMQHGQYATVGLEDHTGARGLEFTYNNTYPTAAATLQNNLAIKFTTMGGGAQSPPILDLSQNSFNFMLQPGTSGSQYLEISNIGEANLIYSLSKSYVGYSDDPGRGHGGPDDFGYEWFDSNEPDGPDYNWRDISEVGTEVTFSSNNTGTDLIPIGFNFYYYGTYYPNFRINPNGWIGFGEDNSTANNLSLPHPYAPNPAIMPFWDDLDPISGGNVFYYSTTDSLVVWYDDVVHTAGNYTGTYDFQLILYPNGDIVFQYREMTGDIDSATIGMQDNDANDALQIVYNGTFVENEFCVIFRKIVDWMQIDPTYGYIEQGESAEIEIFVDATELIPDQFSCDIILVTNDPDASSVTIPINLTIAGSFPVLDISTDCIDFGNVVVGEQVTDTLVVSNIGNEILNITDIDISESEFSINMTNFSIEPGNYEELYITFSPLLTTPYFATMTIFNNDQMNPEAEIDLIGNNQFPNIDLSTESIDFGGVVLGEQDTETLIVSNLGSLILHVSNVELNSDVFSADLDEFFVEPGESQEINIVYTPIDTEASIATMIIYNNDPENSQIEVELSGEPLYPEIDLSSSEVDFGSVYIGEDIVDSLTIINTGTAELNITEINLSSDVFFVSVEELIINPGESEQLYITFVPDSVGTETDTLVMNHNDPLNLTSEIILTGSGEQPVNANDILPIVTEVYQNYPNPFNPVTTIRYSLVEEAKVSIIIFNVKGEKVRTLVNEYQEPQFYQTIWNGTDANNKKVASGVYFYKFLAGKHLEIKKMLLIK